MTNGSQPATVTYVSESIFVNYPPSSPARARTTEALLLRALADDQVDRPEASPLVALSRSPLHLDYDPSYTKRSMTGVLKLDMGNKLEEIGEALLPPPSHIPTPSLLRKRKLILDEAYLHALLANWEGKSEVDKTLIMANAMPREGTLTFTVHFGEKRYRSLDADVGFALKKVRNELAGIAALGPTLAILERGEKGRLHFHGMVMTDASEATLHELLLKLGGLSMNPRFRKKIQVVIKPATCSVGWGLYMTKALHRLPASEASKLIYASQSARRLGKAHLEELRAASIRKLGIKPDFRGRNSSSRKSIPIPGRCVRHGRTKGPDTPRVNLCVSLPPLDLLAGHWASLENLDFQPDSLTLAN